MKRPGLIAAGLLGSATSLCLFLGRSIDLGAAEDGEHSFRQALKGAPQTELVEQEDGIRLNYFDASWDRVLKNLAESHELTLVMERVPPGRFARRDRTKYDLDSALRILNSELEPQGYRLIHQNQFLIVLNLDSARTEYSRPRVATHASEQSASRALVRNAATTRIVSGSAEDDEATPLVSGETIVPADDVAGREGKPTPRRGAHNGKATPIRQASNGRVVQDEVPAKEVNQKLTLETYELQNGKAVDIARTLFVVFEKRAELQTEGLNGLPGFVVFDDPADVTSDEQPGNLFQIGIDQEHNAIVVEAPANRQASIKRLIGDLDKPTNPLEDEAVKIIPNKGLQAATAKQLTQQIHQLVSMQDGKTAPAKDEKSSELSPDGGAINLRGEVNVQAMQDLGILILKGNEADVAKVEQIVQQLETMSVGSLPSIHVRTVENVDSDALATLLTDVYTQLTELKQRTGGENRKTAAFLPVVQPNAILIISSEIERETVLALVSELDKPLTPDLEFEVFPLKSAIASQVVTALTDFYAERRGLGTTITPIADVRTNSVIVQGRPNELAEVRKLINQIDKDEPAATARMQVVRLKNAVAEELAATINTAIQAVINPPQQTQGQGGFGGFGNTQGAQQLRDNKSIALEFLASAGGVKELIKSGILADVRVSSDVRSNSLIVSAPEASMPLMMALIEELDQTPGAVSEIKVFTLKNADAQQSVDLLTALFENTNQEDALGIQLAGTEGSSSSLIPLRFSADVRTNTVLAVGSGESLSVVEALLLRLDSEDTRQQTRSVIPLRNAPADLVAQTLLDYLDQQQALQDSSEDLISNIERVRQQVLIAPDLNSNSLIVSASPQYYTQITQIIEQLDAQPPEVVIQALLVEVSLDATDEFGIELGFQDPLLMTRSLATTTTGGLTTVGTPGLNFNNPSTPLGNNIGPGSNPGNVATQGLSNFSLGRTNGDLGFGGFVFSAQSDAVSVLLRALASRRTVHVLSRPQVRTTHNNEAYVTVGQQVPVVNGVTTNQLGTANPVVTPQQVGITLRVTPRITPDGIVAMTVFADKSSLSDQGVPIFVQTTGAAIESPIINQSQAQTTVNVPNGQTIVIGGMITKSDSTLERKVPWLGDLPIVGKAFRYDGTTTSRTELLIFLTPRIVMSDLDSELHKQVESERTHFIESEAEEVHGPLFSVPQGTVFPEPEVLTPDSPIEEMLQPDISQPVIEPPQN
ncbi:MAG: secretin N-terminal domain-containing protein [Planctomycetaceae bacterium]